MNGSATEQNKEKRRHIRVDFKTRIVIDTGTTEIETKGNSKDLSLKGVFINTDEKLPVGTRCNVSIFLSGGIDDIELKMKAEIVRVDEHGLGIAFGSMDLESYTYLKNIMCYNTDNFDEI